MGVITKNQKQPKCSFRGKPTHKVWYTHPVESEGGDYREQCRSAHPEREIGQDKTVKWEKQVVENTSPVGKQQKQLPHKTDTKYQIGYSGYFWVESGYCLTFFFLAKNIFMLLRSRDGHPQMCLYHILILLNWNYFRNSQCKRGFHDSLVGKESTCNAGDTGSIPGSGRSAREQISYPL